MRGLKLTWLSSCRLSPSKSLGQNSFFFLPLMNPHFMKISAINSEQKNVFYFNCRLASVKNYSFCTLVFP